MTLLSFLEQFNAYILYLWKNVLLLFNFLLF